MGLGTLSRLVKVLFAGERWHYSATVPMLDLESVDHSVSALIVEYKTIVDRSAWLVETAKLGELRVLDGVRLTTMAAIVAIRREQQ